MGTGAAAARTRPELELDLWSDEALLDPYPLYGTLRATAGAVWLTRHELFAISRYDDVRAALQNWRIFSSAHGVMMNAEMNELMRGILLCSDPPRHETLRRVAGRPLAHAALKELEPRIRASAAAIVDELVEKKTFDAATELARHLPVTIISTLVGLPEEGRERMLDWAAANFNCFGPRNRRMLDSLPLLREAVAYSADPTLPERLRPGGWAARLFEAAAEGEISHADAGMMLNDYWAPSLDTTILGAANAIRLFADHPDQWRLVRENPSLVPHAVNETLRLESPIQGFSRYVTQDCVIDGVLLPAGSRAVVLYASANRDERKWHAPERFDVLRKPNDQLAFGWGEHQCLGMPLARLELRALLTALAARVERFELVEAEPLLNNVLHGWARLVVTVS